MQDSSGGSTQVLVIRPGALGDTLVALPALADLNEAVDLVFAGCRPGLDFVARRVRRVLDFETYGWHHLFTEDFGGMAASELHPEAVAVFMNDRGGSVRRNLSEWFPFASIRLFSSLPGDDSPGHVARYIARCLEETGLPLDPERVMSHCREVPVLSMKRPPQARTRVLLHPGSGSVAKNHPIDFWRRLMERMLKEDDYASLEVCVLLGPAERTLHGPLERECRGQGVPLIVQPNPDGLAAIMESAALFVGHDSGVSHLAAMFGVPTLALFKTSRPDRWRPLGPWVRVLLSLEADAGLEKQVLETGRELLRGMRLGRFGARGPS